MIGAEPAEAHDRRLREAMAQGEGDHPAQIDDEQVRVRRVRRAEQDGERVHDQRAVLDAARKRPDVIVHLRQRHDIANAREPVRRFEPDDAATRGREADRRSRVGPERPRAQSSSDCGRL